MNALISPIIKNIPLPLRDSVNIFNEGTNNIVNHTGSFGFAGDLAVLRHY